MLGISGLSWRSMSPRARVEQWLEGVEGVEGGAEDSTGGN
jgi:hypothetical protein